MARLSTHVLDTARGAPAGGLRIDLFCAGMLVKSLVTNTDGRVSLLEQAAPGTYELVFHAGEYFRRLGLELPDPPFFDQITIRFGLADPQGSYHVPLLLSPYGYSTYRGS